MRPDVGQVLHFSEDPTQTRLVPHVAATAKVAEPYVWAVDAACAPSYWFPRQCPRVMAWVGPSTTTADRERIIGAGCGERVHAIEYGWLAAIQTAKLFVYRLPIAPFRPIYPTGEDPRPAGRAVGVPTPLDRASPIREPTPYAMVATEPVEPLGPPEPVGDLLRWHAEAGIQVRLLSNLWSFWDEVVASSLEFSGIRLRNAAPRPA